MMLKDKTILLGVTGGIAAYKSAMLASRLVKTGACVHVHYDPVMPLILLIQSHLKR